jgi:hypothetical protein
MSVSSISPRGAKSAVVSQELELHARGDYGRLFILFVEQTSNTNGALAPLEGVKLCQTPPMSLLVIF